VAAVAAVIRWCWKMRCLWLRSLYLFGDDENDGLDCGLEVWCEVILAKVWDHIVFSFIFGVVCKVSPMNSTSYYLKKIIGVTMLRQKYYLLLEKKILRR
jgi:hypothetical protein